MKKSKKRTTTKITAKAFAENCGLTKAQYDNYVEWCGGGLASFEDFCNKSAEQVADIKECEGFAHGQLSSIANGGGLLLTAIGVGAYLTKDYICFIVSDPLEFAEQVERAEFYMEGIDAGPSILGLPDGDICFSIETLFYNNSGQRGDDELPF